MRTLLYEGRISHGEEQISFVIILQSEEKCKRETQKTSKGEKKSSAYKKRMPTRNECLQETNAYKNECLQERMFKKKWLPTRKNA